eukprot:1196012-Prorocentrum_minimum.AAC.5
MVGELNFRVIRRVNKVLTVHGAVLRGSNKEVVLKVLKPGVSDVLTADLSFLYIAARVLEFLNPSFKRTSLSAIVGDIRTSMMEEVDFEKEARNISQFEVRRVSRGY